METTTPVRQLRFLWLVVPPVLLCMLDFGVTLFGQSQQYWAGNFADVNELSPSFARYLAIHPLAFIGAGVLWMLIFSLIVMLLPETWALTVSIAVVIGHMGGAATWFAYRFHNYQACNALFLATAFVVVQSFKRGQSPDGSAAFDWRRTGLPAWGRWVLVAVLVVIPIWWFLIPH